MNVKQITLEYLTAHGFDGLVQDDIACGCPVFDLMPCVGCDIECCEPAYKLMRSDGDYVMLSAYVDGKLRTREEAIAAYQEEDDE